MVDPASNKSKYITAIGTLTLPAIKIEANRGSKDFNLSTEVRIEGGVGQEALRADVKRLLSGRQLDWFVVSKPTIHVHLAQGITIDCRVNSNDSIQLQGSTLSSMHAANLSVYRAGPDAIYAKAALTMASSAEVSIVDDGARTLTFELRDPDTLLTMGYASVESLVFRTGLNAYVAEIVLVRTGLNGAALTAVLSTFMEQRAQSFAVTGPVAVPSNLSGSVVPVATRRTCIDGTIDTTALVDGTLLGNIGVAGLVTQESEEGWKDVNGTQLQGAYSTLRNCMNLPLRLNFLEADLRLWRPFGFDVNIANLHTAHCPVTGKFDQLIPSKEKLNINSDMLAHMRTGIGMYKDEPHKTWLDIGANAYASMFNIGSPMNGQGGWPNPPKHDYCMRVLQQPFPCCFLFAFTAAACFENPDLQLDKMAQVQQPFIATHLSINATATLGGQYRTDLVYYQDMFPVYFGTPVFRGYLGDAKVSCEDYKFYTNNVTKSI